MGRWEGGSEGGDICVLTVDSRCYIAEIKTTCKAIILQLKLKKKKNSCTLVYNNYNDPIVLKIRKTLATGNAEATYTFGKYDSNDLIISFTKEDLMIRIST